MFAWLMKSHLTEYIVHLKTACDALSKASMDGYKAKVRGGSLTKSIRVLSRHIHWAEKYAAMEMTKIPSASRRQKTFSRLPHLFQDAFRPLPDAPNPDQPLEPTRNYEHLRRAGMAKSEKKTAAAKLNGRLGGLSRSRAKRAAARANGSQPKRPPTSV